MALTGLAQVMSSVFADYNRIYNNSRREQEGGMSSSWWNNVGAMIGNMFIGDEERRRLMTFDDSILLVFYESVHLNRNFISTLTHAATESNSNQMENGGQHSPSGSAQSSVSSSSNTYNNLTIPSSTDLNASFDLTTSQNPNSMRLLNPLSLSVSVAPNSGETASSNSVITDADDLATAQHQVSPPSNLLVIFLQSCSAILQETKMDNNNAYDTVKLFMLIQVCISEDQYANSLLHDSNGLYSVFLYQAVSYICRTVIGREKQTVLLKSIKKYRKSHNYNRVLNYLIQKKIYCV